jgi:hypothetical protein
MGVPTSDVGYTSATNRSGDFEGRKGHVVALGGGDSVRELVRHPVRFEERSTTIARCYVDSGHRQSQEALLRNTKLCVTQPHRSKLTNIITVSSV